MNEAARPSNPTSPNAGSRLRGRWLSPKRKRFWAIMAVLVYTLAGFFAVPPVLESVAVDRLRESTGREASIERIFFNPYVLSLEVNGFALNDTDSERLFSFDRLFVNFQLSSLFRWAWTFREFSLDGLYGLFERYAPGDSRLTRLLDDIEARAEPAAAGETSGGLPRLLVQDLNLRDGGLEFRDAVPQDPVDLQFGPVTVSMQELNTLPDRYGQQSVQILLPNDAVVSWQGTISLAPLHSEGSFSVEGSHLEQTTTYLQALLPIESLQATLSARTRYRIHEQDDGSLQVALDDLQTALSDFAATGLEPSSEFLSFSRLSFTGGQLRYPENTLQFAAVEMEAPALDAWLDEQGEPGLLQLLPETAEPPGDSPPAAGAESAWRLGIDELRLTGGRVAFTDRSIEPQAAVQVEDIELSLDDVSNQLQARMPVSLAGSLPEGGRFGFEGQLVALPDLEASGSATLEGVPLSLAQPYVEQGVNVRIESGTLESSAELTLRPDPELGQTLGAEGTFAVNDLAVNDALENRPLVGWARLETDRFEIDTATSDLRLSRLVFRQPFGRLVINADQTTNISGLTVEDSADQGVDEQTAAAAAIEEPAAGYGVVIGGIEVREGALDFSDLSLPLPFATEIRDLGGTISTISTASTEPANVKLEGQVDEFGLARISGDLNLLDPVRQTDITMEFRNLLMSNLSPYTVQFAGREIDQGKLDLDLQYVIDAGLMKGQNKIVMSDLVLGDKVDHPDAASLPLGLAVALLKDSNGVIDIELPVEGDVNDPQFRIGGVIWQAFVGLVTKIVSAPFRLLGGLVGADADDLGQFQFLAGRADLAPPELESIGLLQEALQKRPELAVEVSGGYAPEIDVPALQYQELRNDVLARMGEDAAVQDPEEVRLLDEALRSALEAIFVERFPETPLETVKAEHTTAPEGDPEAEPAFDELAYAADLRDRLLAAVEITEADLLSLANERAQAILDAFLASGEFDASRITLVEPQETESEDGDWVLMELGVAAD